MTRPYVIVGDPDGRRVQLFQRALDAQGHRPATVIPWLQLASARDVASCFEGVPPDAVLRIESTGEQPEVERALIRRGAAAAEREGAPFIDAAGLDAMPYAFGQILYPRQAYLGFVDLLRAVEAAVDPRWIVLQPIPAIVELFDKRRTSARWAAAGLPVPESLPNVVDPDDLRARMRREGWPAVFVKVASASSASCLAIFSHRPSGEYALTTVKDTGDGMFNTRRLQRLVRRDEIDRLLSFLLAEGAQVERAIPKPRVNGGYFDLRVLMIDEVPAFIVVRVSRHPITNLHLGGRRGSLEDVQRRVPEAAWSAAMKSARQVQRGLGTFHLGVDLLFESDLDGHRIIEGNAFGDLLPNLHRDGLDVYGWQIRRLQTR